MSRPCFRNSSTRSWDSCIAHQSRDRSAHYATWDHARRIINWREVIGAVALIVAPIILFYIATGGK